MLVTVHARVTIGLTLPCEGRIDYDKYLLDEDGPLHCSNYNLIKFSQVFSHGVLWRVLLTFNVMTQYSDVYILVLILFHL